MAIESNFENLNSGQFLCNNLRGKTGNDPHWQEINCGKIEIADADLIGKFFGGILTEEDVDKRTEELENLRKEGEDVSESSYALAGLLKNKIIALKGYRKSKEREENSDRSDTAA
ncbi:MAG: hypothetical protein UW50_C0001G0129 [Candidatus Wolfebacteria bacterium GW2011_GWA1_44_24]|uniref:Uncharacterized protein n=1 Tax=Candidatus Wolfebacteria bacterium GW2011_GWB1_41_12 TaxID=1619006 RepID=A0A0G0WWH3_9BACT|nr:MAG: hypothetical protein UU38_C0003G0046 [Candidatus Wolfebacteria bacterium GW2011_GWB1_41_12]KKT56561.1 MAG: hypothetical protein UW50_C0001G0129 [Candidatus Wolfebacteria bacterium GW2011_GWA1_44_24]